jgi:hypothetical protein
MTAAAATPQLDGADSHPWNRPPGRPVGLVSVAPPVGTAVWVRNGRYRQGIVTSGASRTSHPGASTGGKIVTVEVEYVVNRTGRTDRHRWPVSELRLRDVAS